MRKWSKTAYGRVYKCWGHILERVENKDGKHPTYAHVELRMTREEFFTWALPRYKRWLKNHPHLRPSVHRSDDCGHYEITNLRLISYTENTMLQRRYKNVNAPRGMAWCGACKTYKTTKEFNKNRQGSNGLHWYCRYHEHLKHRQRRYANLAFYREKEKLKMRRLRKKWRST